MRKKSSVGRLCYMKSCIIRYFLRMYPKIFHVTIKDLRICAKNPVLEDFVIRNHYQEFFTHVHKNL